VWPRPERGGCDLGDGGRLVRGSGDVLATLHHASHLAGGFVDDSLSGCLRFIAHTWHHVVDSFLEFVRTLLQVVATGVHSLSGDDADTHGNVRGIARNLGGRGELLAEIHAGEIEGREGVGELDFWHALSVIPSANFCKHIACEGMWHASSVGSVRRDDPC
jgi:hypothetical protein